MYVVDGVVYSDREYREMTEGTLESNLDEVKVDVEVNSSKGYGIHCAVCDGIFSTSKSLKTHMKRMHKVYLCRKGASK